MVRTPLRATRVHVPNRPAKFPPIWPIEMRAETAAAFLDYATTRELCKAIQKGDAAPPTACRTVSGRPEAVWLADAIREFASRRHAPR